MCWYFEYLLENYVTVNLKCKALFGKDMQSNKIVKEFCVIILQLQVLQVATAGILYVLAHFFNGIA